MYEQTELEPLVRQWEAEGKWIDCGSWRPARNGQLEYHPTPTEIEAKCELLRQIENWQGAYKRSPRGGKYAVIYPRTLNIL